ncbi:Ppx/GppA family phosphatase [Peptacetobacter hiranonis]|uniref:Ppx/GppA phosphatase family protein n=1 Tax=Peptacetobacter hiranonis TaxID=89152 RepID=UPI0019177614|nr:Ppx/GppA phosphatase family protein [Peptacetobacter hiranonis]QQQ87636.1 Ppx/GppA family phosphatase [Peptacetobacter hiranonis]
MKIGAIDIGTNSMRLLTADLVDGKLNDRKKYVNTTRIGQGVDENGFITEEAMKRNINAIKEYHDICVEYGCEKIYCMGTSALRDSKNRSEFIKRAKDEAGIDVNVVDGEVEARLGFSGVISGIDTDGDILVIDIGGGSTEFIFGNREGIKRNVSINIGALRLTEKFLSEGYTDAAFSNMREFINDQIKGIIAYIKEKKISCVCGIGGTITSLSAVNQNLEVYSMEKVHGSRITKKEVYSMLDRFVECSDEERKHINGLQPKRADIIAAGTEILICIIENLSKDEVVVSEYDNLEGMAYYNIL